MVIVMAQTATQSDVDAVIAQVHTHGGQAFVSRGVTRTIIGVVGEESVLETIDVTGLSGVADTKRITAPYKLVSADNHTRRTTIRVGGVPIGPDTFTLIAGPCAVETPEQTLESALLAKRADATPRRRLQTPQLAVRLSGFGLGGTADSRRCAAADRAAGGNRGAGRQGCR